MNEEIETKLADMESIMKILERKLSYFKEDGDYFSIDMNERIQTTEDRLKYLRDTILGHNQWMINFNYKSQPEKIWSGHSATISQRRKRTRKRSLKRSTQKIISK
jgi:hypothetical protein